MTDVAVSPAPAKASPFHALKVLWVRHWTDSLFSFAVERPEDFRFRSGEFVMIGLPGEDGGKPILRAYSIASPAGPRSWSSSPSRWRTAPLPRACRRSRPGTRC